MSCARYREKLSEALYCSEDDGLKDVHMLTCSAGSSKSRNVSDWLIPLLTRRGINTQLNFQNHRQYERPLGRLFIEELLQILPDLFFDHSPIATFFYRGVSNRIRQHLFAFRKQP